MIDDESMNTAISLPGGFKHMLQVVLTGLTSKSNQNATLTFISVLSPASLDLHHCLTSYFCSQPEIGRIEWFVRPVFI